MSKVYTGEFTINGDTISFERVEPRRGARATNLTRQTPGMMTPVVHTHEVFTRSALRERVKENSDKVHAADKETFRRALDALTQG